MNWIEVVRRCFESDQVLYSAHARREMLAEEFGPILDQEVCQAICGGDLIQAYADDQPYPSALILGRTETGRPLHVVCAYDKEGDRVVVVTVYQPDPLLWTDSRMRKP